MVGLDVWEFHLRNHQPFVRAAINIDLDREFFPRHVVTRLR